MLPLLFVVMPGVGPRRVYAANPAQLDTHLATMRSAYSMLLDAYLRPVDPVVLLSPALDTVEASNRLAAGSTTLPADRDGAFAGLAAAYQRVATLLNDSDAQDLAFRAIDAMTRALHDDHTSFIAPAAMGNFAAQLSGAAATGSGFTIGIADPLFVREVAPDSPADRAGLRPGDALITVNGIALTRQSFTDQSGILRGDSGPYTLRIRRKETGESDLTITPGAYHFPEWTSRILPGDVGLMRLRNFIDPWQTLDDGRSLDNAITQALESFERAGVRYWVLDLRGNPGGSGLLVDALTGRFVADSPIDRQFDQRGHLAGELTDGRLFRVQRPLAVLVDGASTSASDLSASVFKESGRALLVGQRTGGALGNAAIWYVGEGAGLEISFADLHSGLRDAVIDRVGVNVDVQTPNRTVDDYATGRDPQLDSAIAALQQQDATPRPPTPNALIPLGQAGVEALLLLYRPASATLTAPPSGGGVRALGGYTLVSANDYNNWATATVMTSGSGGGRDPVATRNAALSRGWLGGHIEVYAGDALGPALWVCWDAYTGPAGAAAALAANDFPDQRTAFPAAIQLGDDITVAERGSWGDLGTLILRWRHGSTVLTAEYQSMPGSESLDALLTLAGQVDTAYRQAPVSFAFTWVIAPILQALGRLTRAA